MITETITDAIAQTDFLSQIQEQAAELSRVFLSFCQSVWVAKSTSVPKEWKEIRESLGWLPSTASRYAKVAEFLTEAPIESLEVLDVQTMMAISALKYQPIVEEMAIAPLSVQEVRQMMKSINKETKKKAVPANDINIIRRDVNGSRYAQIPPMYDQNAISSLARQMSMEGKSAQTIAAEGVLLRERAILALKGLEIPEQLSEAIAEFLPAEQVIPLLEGGSAKVEPSGSEAWEKAQQELAEYMESQLEEVTPASGLEIGDKVKVAGQVGTIVGFEEKPYTNEIHPMIAWGSGGKSALSPRNVEAIDKVAQPKKMGFAISDKVAFRGETYTVASEPDEDGDILVIRPNGTTRFLQGAALQKVK